MRAEKRKVLFVASFHIGGIATTISTYRKVLENNGFETHLIGPLSDVAASSNTKQTVINHIEKEGFLPSLHLVALLIIELTKLHAIFSYDIVQVNTIWMLLAVKLTPVCWGKQVIYTFHGLRTQELINLRWDKKILYFVATGFIEQLLPLLAHKILVYSNYSKEFLFKHLWLKKSLQEKIALIPFFLNKSNKITRPTTKIEIAQKELILLNYGRAEPRKGVHLLLKAAALLRNEIPLKIFIASPVKYYGYSNLFEIYQDLNLFDTVHFLHKVDSNQKAHLLTKADLFIMPSTDLETFGITVLESLQAGVPVISSDNGALTEIASKLGKDFIFRSNDPADLAKKIKHYYSQNTKQKNEYRKKSKQVIENFFSDQVHQKKVVDIFRLS